MALVGQHQLGLTAFQQGQRLRKFRRLAGGEAKRQGQAQAVCQQVGARAQSTSGRPQSLVFAAFFRPWPLAREPA